MLVIRRAPAEESARQAITTDQSIQAPSAATRAFSRGFVENNHWLTAGKGDGGIGATGDEAFKKGAEPPKSPPDWEPWLKKNPVCWKAWKNVAGRSPERIEKTEAHDFTHQLCGERGNQERSRYNQSSCDNSCWNFRAHDHLPRRAWVRIFQQSKRIY